MGKVRQQAGAAYFRLGQIHSDLGDHAAAITHFEQARNLFAELAEQHTVNPTFRQELARSYGQLALQMRESGRPEVAEANYRAAVIVNEKLVDEFPADAEYRHDLASSYDDRGLHLWFVGRAADAEASTRAAQIVRQRLADDFPLNADYQNELAETLLNLSMRRLEGFQDASGAKALLDQGFHHHEAAMTSNPRHPAYRELFAENRRWLSKALLGMGDFEGLHGIVRMIQFVKPNAMICVDGGEGAVSVAQSGLAVRKRLAQEFPSDLHYRLGLAISYEHLGDVLLDAGRNADAAYAHSLAIYRQFVETYPTIPDYRSHLASFLSHACVNQLVKARRFAEAEAACREAVAIQEGLVDGFPQASGHHSAHHAELALSLSALARLRLLDNAPAEARRLAELSRTRMEAVYRNEPNHPWYRRYYSVCLATLGAISAAVGDGKVVAELIDRLKSGLSEPILDRYNAACLAARYARHVARNAKLPKAQRQKMAGDYCDQAMDLLRQTIQAGFQVASFIETDSDLELLHDREDFQKLITELEARRKTNKP